MLHMQFIITKMSIKKLPQVGKVLNIFLVLIVVYMIYTIIYYVKSQIYLDGLLRMPDQPLLLYVFKWTYALLLLVGITQLNKKSRIAYLLVNSASVAIIFLWILVAIYLIFYISVVDKFLLELIAIGLIIVTNMGNFIKQYSIKRKLLDLFCIVFIPLVLTIGLYYLVTFLINNSIICIY